MNVDSEMKGLIRELVLHHGVERLDVSEEPLGAKNIEYEDSDECHWVKGKDDVYRCEQRPGEKCRRGVCKGITVTVKVNGVTRTVSYCECSGAP